MCRDRNTGCWRHETSEKVTAMEKCSTYIKIEVDEVQ